MCFFYENAIPTPCLFSKKKVIVTAEYGRQKFDIWSGRQQDLFRKNAAKREKSIAEIKQNLMDFSEEVIGN